MLLEIIEYTAAAGAYAGIGGATFRVLLNRTADPTEPWQHGYPLFGAMFWFIGIPTALGVQWAGRRGLDKRTKVEIARDEELARANHAAAVASAQMQEDVMLQRRFEIHQKMNALLELEASNKQALRDV
jgi:hypothetical protein